MDLEKLNKIIITEFKTNFLKRAFLSLFVILFTNIIYGFSNLNEIESLLPLERFIPLIGLIFIMQVLEGELDSNIYQVVKVRETYLILIYIIRLIIAIALYSVLIVGVLYYMDKNNCIIDFSPYFLETLSIGILLGSIGLMITGITQNKIYSLLGSLSYYLMSWFVNYKKLGWFYLFRLSRGLDPLNEFKYLLSFILITIGLIRFNRRNL